MVETKANGYLGIDLSAGLNLYRAAYEQGLTFSQFLEKEDPSENYSHDPFLGKMDAFERQLFRAGIKVKSDPNKGIYADKVEKFFIGTGTSSVLFPEFINRTARQALLASDILNELVAIRTPIEGNAYRTFYVDLQTSGTQKKRVAEGTELPEATIANHENTVKLYKKGILIKASYESIRRMRIDMLQLLIQGILLQTGIDLANTAVSVLVNGDGNPNTAATNYRLAADLGGTAGTIDYASWTKYRLKGYPYQGTTSIVDETQIIKVLSIQFPTVDPLSLLALLQQGGGLTAGRTEFAQPLFGPMRLVYLPNNSDIANKVLTIDPRYALEQINEVGADIVETDRLINTQFERIALSQVVGFAVFFPQAVKTLQTNA